VFNAIPVLAAFLEVVFDLTRVGVCLAKPLLVVKKEFIAAFYAASDLFYNVSIAEAVLRGGLQAFLNLAQVRLRMFFIVVPRAQTFLPSKLRTSFHDAYVSFVP
jgi:hypothetical protein